METIGNALEDVGFLHAVASVVDAWSVDDYNGLSGNTDLDDADVNGA